MSREIPFFELFAQLQLSPELRLKLLGAVIASACCAYHPAAFMAVDPCLIASPLVKADRKSVSSMAAGSSVRCLLN